MTEAAFWWVNTVTSEPYLGQNSLGPSYGTAQTIACWVEDETKMVRNTEGSEVVSSGTLYAPLGSIGAFPPGTRVTLPSGRKTTVIDADVADSGTLDLGLDHIKVSLA